MSYIYAMTDTWNASGTTWYGIRMSVTDTASAAGSKLLQINGGAAGTTEYLSLSKAGLISGVNMTLSGVVGSSAITVTGITQTTSQPVLNLSQTWNNAAVAFTGLKFNATDTASDGASILLSLEIGGSYKARVNKYGSIRTVSGLEVANDSGAVTLGVTDDVRLHRDAANALAQRNGVNAQTFNLYNTYTDASNYERLSLTWSGNVAVLAVNAAGSGTARSLSVGTNSASSFDMRTASTNRWTINSSGHFLAYTDNTYDIGASGANRPRIGYFAQDVYVGNGYSVRSPTKGRLNFGAGDGIITLYNDAATDFSRLQFGGTSASFPAIARNSTFLDIKLADDSGFGGLRTSFLTSFGQVTAALGTITSSNPSFNATQTWNSAAVAFTASLVNVTDTASLSSSLLLDLQVGGTSQFKVRKDGYIFPNYITLPSTGGVLWTSRGVLSVPADGQFRFQNSAQTSTVDITVGSTNYATFSGPVVATAFYLASTQSIFFDSGVSNNYKMLKQGSGLDIVSVGAAVRFTDGAVSNYFNAAADGANTMALRNGASALTLNLYNTFTDASNYERVALTWASNVCYLRPQNAGTGSARIFVPVTGATTVASLPSASTAGAGARAFVTDATATTFLSIVAGGGANKVPVVSDGTNWLIG